jgi:uncharacterized membrane protein YhhN
MAQIALVPFLVLSVGLLLRAEAQSRQVRIYTYKPLSTVLVIGIAGLCLSPALGAMRGPVIVYMLLISLTVNRAVATSWSDMLSLTQPWMLSVGAALFWVSDLMPAIAHFRQPFPHQRLSLAACYVGQLLIALSGSFFGSAVASVWVAGLVL